MSNDKEENVGEKRNETRVEEEVTLWGKMRWFFKGKPETVVNLNEDEENMVENKKTDTAPEVKAETGVDNDVVKVDSEVKEEVENGDEREKKKLENGIETNVIGSDVIGNVVTRSEITESEIIGSEITESEITGSDVMGVDKVMHAKVKVQESVEVKYHAKEDEVEDSGGAIGGLHDGSFGGLKTENGVIGHKQYREARPPIDNGPLLRISEEGAEGAAPLAEPEGDDHDDRYLIDTNREFGKEKEVERNGIDWHSDNKSKGFWTRRRPVIHYEIKPRAEVDNLSRSRLSGEQIKDGAQSEKPSERSEKENRVLSNHKTPKTGAHTFGTSLTSSDMTSEHEKDWKSDDQYPAWNIMEGMEPSSPRHHVTCTISTVTVVKGPRKQRASSDEKAAKDDQGVNDDKDVNDNRGNADDLGVDFLKYDGDDDDDDDDDDEGDADDQHIKQRKVPKSERKAFVLIEKKTFNPVEMEVDLDDEVFEDCLVVDHRHRTSREDSVPADEAPVQPVSAEEDVEGTEDIIKLLEEMDRQDAAKTEEDSKRESGGVELAPVKRVSEGSNNEEEKVISIDAPIEHDFTRLETWDNEPTDWWTNTKKTRDYDVWIKPMKDGTITRAVVPFLNIPYKDAVRLITDWGYRRQWDKTFLHIDVFKTDGPSTLVHCPLNKQRDLTLSVLDKNDKTAPSYVTAWRRHQSSAPSPTKKRQSNIFEFDTRTCGMIIRPAECESEGLLTRLSILCQLTGPVDHVIKHTYLAGEPQKWLKNLQKYYETERKQQQFKVIKL